MNPERASPAANIIPSADAPELVQDPRDPAPPHPSTRTWTRRTSPDGTGPKRERGVPIYPGKPSSTNKETE